MNLKRSLLLTCFTGFMLAGFFWADDIITRLGMTQYNARFYVLNNLLGNYNSSFEEGDEGGDADSEYKQMQQFQIPYAKLLPSIISDDKAGAAKELCVYVKQYCNSQDFMDDYNKKREACKPTSEPYKPDEETIKGMRKEYDSQKADYEKQKKAGKISKEIQAAYESNLKSQGDMLAQWEDPHPNQTKWEKQFPADPANMIKTRLQEYLTLVATVDFNAQLGDPDKYKKRKFLNPEYEKKPLKWKACYRAGKEVNDVVTAFVKEWLKGPILSATKEKMPAEKTNNQGNATTVKNNPTTSNSNGNTNTVVTNPAPVTDTVAAPAKGKNSLFNKLKGKAKSIIH